MSIARSLLLALLGLTLALAVIAGLGVASLYGARQDYEDRLAAAYATESATANLLAAGVIEEAVLRNRTAQARRDEARVAYERAASAARNAARGDGASERLLSAQITAQARARELAARGARFSQEASEALRTGRSAFTALAERQRQRRVDARDEAASDSRRATLTAAVAGGLALIAALGLVAALVAGLRRPLDGLVGATQRLAAGDLDARVDEEGPAELRALARAFNAMSQDLRGAQEALERERRRLALVIASLGDGLLVCDPDGTIVEANPLAGVLVPELTPGERPEPLLPPLEEALDQEASIEHGGRTLAVIAAPLEGADGRGGTVWTIRDVSERARLERLKTEFVATASHELRSPLTSIKGFVELLAVSADLSPKQSEFVDIIRVSTNRLVDLVSDLLDVARIEAGRLQVQRRPMAIGEAIEEVAALLQPRIEDKHQALTVDVPSSLPTAFADPTRVRQILTNLLTNAHLYTPDGGKLRIAAAAEEGWLTLTVSDTGRGIEPEALVHIFDRFFRARTDEGNGRLSSGGGAAGAPPGSGLGLSIVKSLVDLHGGSIDVQSTPAGGTTFTVRLPRLPAAADLSAPREAIRGKKLLIVDDEPAIAQLIASQLAPYDVDTTVVHSGEDAMRRLRAERYDGVTLDILMAGMSGLEVLRLLREDPTLRRTPVVVVSVVAEGGTLEREWLVSKPIDAAELTDALGSAILAGRSRLLVVARANLRPTLQPALDRLGIEHEWATNSMAAGRMCEEQRYEVALVDAGIRSPQAVLAQLDLRGRRLKRTIIVFTTGEDAPGLTQLDYDPIPVEQATEAVLAALGSGEDG